MQCDAVKTLFLDKVNGQLPAAQSDAFHQHLQLCESCRTEFQNLQETLAKLDQLPNEVPSPRLRKQFYEHLDQVLEKESKTWYQSSFEQLLEAVHRPFLLRPAHQALFTLAVLVGGIAIGARLPLEKKEGGPSAGGVSPRETSAQRELADLRSQIDSMSRLVAYSLARQEPENTRLAYVATRLGDGKLKPEALAQLVSTLAFDPSTNVRLSALEALYAHADQALAREGVLSSLARERSPLVQLAMIDFLTSIREPQAASAFLALSRDASIDKEVRDAAQRALAQL